MKPLLLILVLLSCPMAWAVLSHTQSSAGYCNDVSGHGNISSSCGSTTTSITFSFTATNVNDAVVFMVGCGVPSAPASLTLSASGWTITALSSVTGSSAAGFAATFGAIAPNTTATTFTITASAACSGQFMNDLVDEFTGNDTTGGTTTFDNHSQATATSCSSACCQSSATTGNANDAVWGACQDTVTAVGSGYTVGANDASGDWGEYKITTATSGTNETVTWTGSGAYVSFIVTIKPAGAAAACNNLIALLGAGCK